MASDFPLTPFSQLENSTTIVAVCSFLGIAEFLIYMPTFPLLIFCLSLIYRTSILHQNLKFILLSQFCVIFLYNLLRSWHLGGNLFVYRNIFWYPPNIVLAAGFWSILFGNIVGHVMMVERMLATLFVAKYEKNKGLSFTIIWLLIAIILCTTLSYHQIYVLNSLFFESILMFSIVAFVMMTSFIEIFGIILLMKFNKKLFVTQNAEMVNDTHQLTVRYQLTENIRTGRQLAPNFICHFIGVLLTFVFITNNCFQLFTKPEYLAFIIQSVVFIHSINHFMLPIAIIRFHPILNQSAQLSLWYIINLICLCRNNRILPMDVSLPVHNAKTAILPVQNAETEIYFRQLQTLWDA